MFIISSSDRFSSKKKDFVKALCAVFLILTVFFVSACEEDITPEDDTSVPAADAGSEEIQSSGRIGEVSYVKGQVIIRRVDTEIQAILGGPVEHLDTIATGESEARTLLLDDAKIIFNEDSLGTLMGDDPHDEAEIREEEGSRFYLSRGTCSVFSCGEFKMHSNTSVINTGDDDTSFVVWETTKDWLKNQGWITDKEWAGQEKWEAIAGDENITCTAPLRNIISINNVDGNVRGDEELEEGEMGCVAAGQAPVVEPIIVKMFTEEMLKEGVEYIQHKCRPKCPPCQRPLFVGDSAAQGGSTDTDDKSIGEVTDGYGSITREGQESDVGTGDDVLFMDTAKTFETAETDFSGLKISLTQNGLLILGAGEVSTLSVPDYSQGGSTSTLESLFFLEQGRVRSVTCQNRIEIRTDNAIAASESGDYLTWLTQKKWLDQQEWMTGSEWATDEGWTGKSDDAPVTCAAVFGETASLNNIDTSIRAGSQIPEGYMSCVSDGMSPLNPVELSDAMKESLLANEEENQGLVDQVCYICVPDDTQYVGPCALCQDGLIACLPDGTIIGDPDDCLECKNCKVKGGSPSRTCDDGDPCTTDDRCAGEQCKGKKDPSPVDPECL